MTVDLSRPDALERAVAQSDAKELMKQIGVLLAKMPQITDDQALDAMEKILLEYILAQREGKSCPVCARNPFVAKA